MPEDPYVTSQNAPQKLAELGAALNIDTRTQAEIRRQELDSFRNAANAAALGPKRFDPVNMPG